MSLISTQGRAIGGLVPAFPETRWLTSLSNPADTEAFLATQGYIWDTQSDMLWCLIGSIAALILLRKLHNNYLLKIGVS